MSLKDLPDFPALQRLGAALWRDGQARGAAVLVGAGFSRNAIPASHDTRPLPLWSDLALSMADRLYPDGRPGVPRDPLRLAEEFRTYFGQAVMTEFLREQVPDESWQPGDLHRRLMALPWSDVLTTNYDTLLERASRTHGVVRSGSELSQVKGPRVIKLHGSIDGHGSPVIAEEDYRTYPSRAAAFVNTARQVFLENELCLVGFSGDDPNFLQWSGWVRDHLGGEARRIYLVGSLDLGPAKRRLLEARGVVPIDFAPLTRKARPDDREREACGLFLGHLASVEPERAIEWLPAARGIHTFIPIQERPSEGDEGLAACLARLELAWRTDRISAPSWLVPPTLQRVALAWGSRPLEARLMRLSATLPPPDRCALLTEAGWRHQAALEPSSSALTLALLELTRGPDLADGPDRIRALRFLLQEARLDRDEARFHEVGALLGDAAPLGSDAHADLEAQRLLWARDGLETETVLANIGRLAGSDPAWSLLKAALLCECGEAAEAKRVLAETWTLLEDRRHRDPGSVATASRSAWADVFRAALDLTEYRQSRTRTFPNGVIAGYDPWEEIDELRRMLRTAQQRRMEEPDGLQPQFGPGAYQDHTRTRRHRPGHPGQEADLVFRFADAACLPLAIANVDLLRSVAEEALALEPLSSLVWHLRLLRVITIDSPALGRHFDSVAVARLDAGVFEQLITRVGTSLRYWLRRMRAEPEEGRFRALGPLRAMVEVLSRLTVRGSPERAQEAFRLGCEIARDPQVMHTWMHEVTSNLIKRSLLALPPDVRATMALECLEFPLPTEGTHRPERWPDPVDELFGGNIAPTRPASDPRWALCVDGLLTAAGGGGLARAQAVHRLAYLANFGCLEDGELSRLGTAIWMRRDAKTGGLPSDVNLYPHVLAALPAPPEMDRQAVLRTFMFSGKLTPETVVMKLDSLVAAANSEGRIEAMRPTRLEALGLLDEMSDLVNQLGDSRSAFPDYVRDLLPDRIGAAVGCAILPSLEVGDLDETRLGFVRRLIASEKDGGAVEGLHELARLQPGTEREVAIELRRLLARGGFHKVVAASRSITLWARRDGEARYPPLPGFLKEAVLSALEVGVRPGLYARIACSRELLALGALSGEERTLLADTLLELRADLDYSGMPREGADAVAITLARAECVRCAAELAKAGLQANGWLDELCNDPLPEVRFALSGPPLD